MADALDPATLPQARRVILVRHARSRARPAVPATEWELSEDGEAAAHRLTGVALFEHATGFYAGPEPKMAATLAPVAAERGLAVQAVPDFAESQAGAWLEEAAFLAAVGRYLGASERPAAPGWETASAATARFAAAIERRCAEYGPVVHPGHVNPGTFAVASGGRVLTAYLASLFGWTVETAFCAWRGLRQPDLAVLEFDPHLGPRLVIPFGLLALPPSAGDEPRRPAAAEQAV